MRSLTIGLVCPYDFSAQGGVQEHTKNLGSALSKLGHSVLYFSPSKLSDENPQPHITTGYSVRIPTPNGSWAEVSVSKYSGNEIQNFVKMYNIDVLHFQELLAPFSSWTWLKYSTVPNVATFHSGWEINSKKQDVFSLFIEFVKSQTALSKFQTVTVSKIAENCNKPLLRKNTVIPPAINIFEIQKKRPRPKQFAKSGFHIVFVGRLDERKGAPYLLQALRLLPQEVLTHSTLHIIGDGPEKLELVDMTTQYQLSKHVVFEGSFSDSKKIRFLQHADLFVAPTTHGESFGMVLIEALAAGVPVIAGNNLAYLTTLSEYPYKRYILDPKNSKNFADQITRLLTNKRERSQIKLWSKNFVTQFSADVIATKHLELYSKIVKHV